MYFLDYLNMFHTAAGLFIFEEEAQNWIDTHDSERADFYKIGFIDINGENSLHVSTRIPRNNRYVCVK